MSGEVEERSSEGVEEKSGEAKKTKSDQAAGSFGMEHAEPPPVYSNTDTPPSYQPPEGGSKVALELVEQRRVQQVQQESGSTSVPGPQPIPARTI